MSRICSMTATASSAADSSTTTGISMLNVVRATWKPMSIWTAPIRVEDEGRRSPARNVKEDHQMKQYLLSVYHPEGEALAPEVQEKAGRDVDDLNQQMNAAGAWLSAGALQRSS